MPLRQDSYHPTRPTGTQGQLKVMVLSSFDMTA